MQQELQGKVALVTGGTSGIGKATSWALGQAGAKVYFVGTNSERGAFLEKEWNKEKEPTFFFKQASLQKQEEVEALVKDLVEKEGRLDILVHSAGITKDGLLLRMKKEDWQEVMDINLSSFFYLAKECLRPMMKTGGGRIIGISSVSGVMGNAGQVNYASSKAGMIGFVKSLAKEVASRNILVNAIAPGFIETPMTDALNETQKEGVLKEIPLKRMGTAEEIASLALFLSGAGSSYITGQVIVADGGLHM